MVLVLDRDGVLVKLVARLDGYRAAPQQFTDVELDMGAVEEAKKAVADGWIVVLCSNQPDAADPDPIVRIRTQLVAIHVARKLQEVGLPLQEFYCMHGRDMGCTCRKPKTGLLEQIQKEYSCTAENMWVVGDRSRDIESAQRWGCHSVFVQDGQDEGVLERSVVPDAGFPTAAEAIRFARQQRRD